MVIDDYKEIVSEEEFNKLKDLIRVGKVEIGPWYVLADEFLVGGESLLKNLELGMDIAKELGSKYDIGYLPDTFGHISQIPQVLKGYGIHNAIIWRGAVSDTFENNWVSSDGIKVLTFVLPLFDGYYQTYMKHNNWEEKLNKYISDNESYCQSGQVLVMNGADHTYTSNTIGERIKEFREKNPELEIEEVLMGDYVRKFENFKCDREIFGEQRNQNKIYTLQGVLSARMYLKQGNQKCEDEIINTLEFLNAWTNGRTKSDNFITYLWKLLVQNHAHDSICGCSIDEVHEEIEIRFKKILAAISQFKKSTLEEIYPWDYTSYEFVNDKLYLINNVPFNDDYIVEAEILVPSGADKGSIKLFHKEEEMIFEILERNREEILYRDIKIEPHYANIFRYKVRFTINFDGIESKRIDIILCKKNDRKREKDEKNNWIENKYYKIKVSKTGLTILDKINNKLHEAQNVIISSLDAGDTYNYSPPKNDIITRATVINTENYYKSKVSEEFIISYRLEVPKSLTGDRVTGTEETVQLIIKTKVTLIKESTKILFETSVNNVAKDHKLRVGFKLGSCETHYSDTAFDIVKRGVLRNQCMDVGERQELECNQHPTLSTIYANDIQVVHLGMQEYEVAEHGGEDYCFITALRCVGDLSRRDLRTRGGGAGPGYATPGAQCQGKYIFNYGLILGKEKFNINNKNIIRSKVIAKQSNVNVEDKKLIVINNNQVAYSSIVRKKDGALQLRLFNQSDKVEKVTVINNSRLNNVQKVTFNGEIINKLQCLDRNVTIDVKPREIYTIEFN